MKKCKQQVYTVWLVVTLLTIFTWYNLYNAQFLEYDLNFALIISIFLLSVLISGILIVLWFIYRAFISRHSIPLVVYLVLNSPLTVGIAIFNYESIFGRLQV